MVYLDPMAVVAEGVPWWVILLAVLAGLLVLALLVLLLWKVRLGEGWSRRGLGLQAGGQPLVLLSPHLATPYWTLAPHAPVIASALDISKMTLLQTLL